MKFYIKDCPDHLSMAQWLKLETDWLEKAKEVGQDTKYPYNQIFEFSMENFDVSKLLESTLEVFQQYGMYGFKSKQGEEKSYRGVSLVYNPERINDNPNAATFGEQDFDKTKHTYYWGDTKAVEKVKNSYFDTFGFRIPSPAAEYPGLKEFLNCSLRTRVRSRISNINGRLFDPKTVDAVGWHKDEEITENLRINIPLCTQKYARFQFENSESVHLEVGKAYSFNSHFPHRVYTTNYSPEPRVHMVLGFSPWWDYLPEEQAWTQNEYYGKIHPIDMLKQELIFKGIKE